MNQWAFVTAAYVVTLISTAVLIIYSLAAMRRAERAVDELDDRP